MNFAWLDLVNFSTILLGILTTIILLIKNKSVKFQKFYLIFFASILTLGSIAVFIINLGFTFSIQFFCYYYHITVFILPVIFFVYSRSVLFDDINLRLLDVKHLIPIIFLLAFFPLVNTEFNSTKSDFFKYGFQILLVGYYWYAQSQMLFNFIKSSNNNDHNKIRWLITINLSFLLITFPGLLINMAGPQIYFLNFAKLAITAAVLIFIVYLFFQPEWLYGATDFKYNSSRKIGNNSNRNQLKNFNNISEKLTEYFNESKPFLQKGYSLQALSSDLDVSYHDLSYFLNHRLNITFNDFINKFRVEYVAEVIMYSEGSNRYTLEALAKDAGFGNRTTFISAFKKFIGKTPSHYLKSIQNVNHKQTTISN